ncbi:50S ribosomal protein L33 domain protein [Aneurinibacillus aneurinilyticus ATCC 12856]|uniref:50S ribosomal protein L33 domain protein n=1 Tax=Aneurinibacillus aneurinilyticus ATCC 12856 TaxID=649747 RepID=U1Y994_ANEAE|nr:50S ribosomal protein L33 domain protein [Aneurinibacillus aneurinilyticus ATCC 12856]
MIPLLIRQQNSDSLKQKKHDPFLHFSERIMLFCVQDNVHFERCKLLFISENMECKINP